MCVDDKTTHTKAFVCKLYKMCIQLYSLLTIYIMIQGDGAKCLSVPLIGSGRGGGGSPGRPVGGGGGGNPGSGGGGKTSPVS